jgi:hypothetical protein
MQTAQDKQEWEKLWLQVRGLDEKTTSLLFTQVFGHLEYLNDKKAFDAIAQSLQSITKRQKGV